MLGRGLTYLDPDKTATLEVTAEPGALRGSSFDGDAGFVLMVDPALPAAEQRIAIRCDLDSCTPDSGTVAPGKVTFELTSVAKKRFAFGVMQLPPGVERPPPLHFAPFLSGKRLLTTQTFRDLFRSEVIRGHEGLGVKDIALLFTDLKGSTALYDRIGDLNAFALVQQHFDRLLDVTVRHNGAIIKTIGDAVMAAFLEARRRRAGRARHAQRDRRLQRAPARQGADPEDRRAQGRGDRRDAERAARLFRADGEHRRARAEPRRCRRDFCQPGRL